MDARSREALLETLIEDEAKEGAPNIDWQRVEIGLFEKIGARRTPKYELRGPRVPLRAVAAVAALAAAVLLGVNLGTSARSPTGSFSDSSEKSRADTLVPIDGDNLVLGKRISAISSNLVVSHRGRGSWTLSPKSTAHVEQRGERLVIVLDQGSVLAEVTPSTTPRRFVVEAGQTRVTVQGTVFRVNKTNDGVFVEVLRGAVSVGPIVGEREEVRLAAPDSARFDYGGVLQEPAGTVKAEAPAPVKESTPAGRNIASANTSSRTKIHRAQQTESVDLRASISSVVQTVRGCFAEQTEARGDMRVSVQTTMVVEALPDGKITAAVFQPPLAPSVESCVAGRLAKTRLAASKQGVQFEQAITLER